VHAIEGEVALNGPGRIAASMTPDAALETARRLEAEAAAALDQGRWPKRQTRPRS
jgi:hypothetical protein